MQGKTAHRIIARTSVAWLIASAIFCSPPVQAQSAVPKYEVDPFWAKLPDNWVVGPLGGACIDARDHVFVLHRQEGLTEAMLKGRDRSDGAKAPIKAPRYGVRSPRECGQFLGGCKGSGRLPSRLPGGQG